VRDQGHGGVFPLLLIQDSSKALWSRSMARGETARNLLQMKIIIASSGAVLASDVRWVRSAMDRTRGLIGVDGLSPGAAMVFEPARQIHTFGMSFALDVVFCDRGWKVLHIVRSMPPRRMTRLVWRARTALELAAGSLPREVEVGESLEVVP
jgi:uncharacterized protein